MYAELTAVTRATLWVRRRQHQRWRQAMHASGALYIYGANTVELYDLETLRICDPRQITACLVVPISALGCMFSFTKRLGCDCHPAHRQWVRRALGKANASSPFAAAARASARTAAPGPSPARPLLIPRAVASSRGQHQPSFFTPQAVSASAAHRRHRGAGHGGTPAGAAGAAAPRASMPAAGGPAGALSEGLFAGAMPKEEIGALR
jgi:hypothetical protein